MTAYVRDAGSGMYWGADIAAATGKDRYGGWSLVVAYDDPSLPLRDLTVQSGYAELTTNNVVTTNVSGFRTPLNGPVNAVIGTITYEGDTQFSGDYLMVNDVRLADASNSSYNFFAGRVSDNGVPRTDRIPANYNNMAIDTKLVNASGIIPNGVTSATFTYRTTGDYLYPAAITSQIDLWAPHVQTTKSVVNLNGNNPALPGDVLEYTLTASSDGLDAATNVVVTDPLPAGTAFVPGSIRVLSGPGGGSYPIDATDTVGDDVAEFNGTSVVARLGTGASATEGGILEIGTTSTFRFRAQVLDVSSPVTVTNTASSSYHSFTIPADSMTVQSNTVETPVVPMADLGVTKTGPANSLAGAQTTWSVTVQNHGPSTAQGVVVTDLMPAGFTFAAASGATCSVADPADPLHVTCSPFNLANGETRTVTFTGTLTPFRSGLR